jgi:hypothetical protein
MGHRLDGAYARIDRADKHFKELETIIERFRKTKKDEFFAKRNHTTMPVHRNMKMYMRTIGAELTSVPVDAAVVVSDVIHNLRAALDYLIYELACENFPNVAHNGTQFIIKDSKADTKSPSGKIIRGFDSESATRLKGLLTHQISAIENLQPYNRVTWTKTLRDISNPDKHRKLTAIGGDWDASSIIEGVDPGTGGLAGRPGKIIPGIGMNGADVYVEAEHSVNVQLPDGTPVLETLEILKRKVRATIDAFKPEFKV